MTALALNAPAVPLDGNHGLAEALQYWRSMARLARKLDGLTPNEARRLLEERGVICRAEPEVTAAIKDAPAPRVTRLSEALKGWRDLVTLARDLEGLNATQARRLLEGRGVICRVEPESPAGVAAVPPQPEIACSLVPATAGEPRRSPSLQARLWPMYGRVERQAQLFGEMLERVEVDPAEAARAGLGGGLTAAARRCLSCTNSAACREWLDEQHAGAAPSFCPNASFLNAVRGRAGFGARA